MAMTPFNYQSLQQERARDCGVAVFAELAGTSREGLLRDLPQAAEGKVTVSQWEDWLRCRGYQVTRCQPDESYTLPCAHLVGEWGYFHWVYEDERGVLDPSPSMQFMPPHDPRMLNFSCYAGGRVLTISVKPCGDEGHA